MKPEELYPFKGKKVKVYLRSGKVFVSTLLDIKDRKAIFEDTEYPASRIHFMVIVDDKR